MNKKITEQDVLRQFGEGFDCSQVVLSHFAPQLGLDRETALRLAAAFGGGMWKGETCGCVAGALMALGLKYGHTQPGDARQKNLLLEKKAQFEARFSAMHKSCICREILGYDLSVPEEMAQIQAQNLLATLCPKVVCDACAILEELL